MRLLTLAFVLALIVVGAHTLARGEEPAGADAAGAPQQVEALQTRCLKLEKQVAYLLAREQALTTYILGAQARGKGMQTMVNRMRSQGFTNRSIPAESRETLLQGLDEIGRDLQKELPALTAQQSALLKAADRIR